MSENDASACNKTSRFGFARSAVIFSPVKESTVPAETSSAEASDDAFEANTDCFDEIKCAERNTDCFDAVAVQPHQAVSNQRKMSLKAPASGRFSTQAAAPIRRMTTAPGAHTAKAVQPLQPKSLNNPAATLAAPMPPPHSATHAAPTAAAKPAVMVAKPTVSLGTVPIARRATLAASDKTPAFTMQTLQRPPSAGVSRPPSAAPKRPMPSASASSSSSVPLQSHCTLSNDASSVVESLSEHHDADSCKSRKLCADDDAPTRVERAEQSSAAEAESSAEALTATTAPVDAAASSGSAPSDGLVALATLAPGVDSAASASPRLPLPAAPTVAATKTDHAPRKRHSASSSAADSASSQQPPPPQLSTTDIDDMMQKMAASTNQAKAREMHLQVQLDRAEHCLASLEQQLTAKGDEVAAALARAHEQQCATDRLRCEHEHALAGVARAHEAQMAALRRELAAALHAAEQSRAQVDALERAASETRSAASPRAHSADASVAAAAADSSSPALMAQASATAPPPLAPEAKAALPQPLLQPQPQPTVAPLVRTSVRVSMYGGRQSTVMGAHAVPPPAAAGWKIRVKEFNLSRFAQRTVGDHAFRELVQRHGHVLSSAVKQDLLSSGSTAEAVFATEAEANVAATELIKDGHVVVHIRTQAQMNAASKP